ncbi:DUF7935 family protein [Wenyingzhuangia sp. IMCC45533]
MEDIIEILKYTVPSLITGGIAAYFLKQFIAEEHSKRKFEMFSEKKKEGLPIRLQAYERMTLFLERIDIPNLTGRIQSLEFNKIEYAQLLIHHINTEFEHNLVQQIYVSSECWNLIKTAKQTTQNMITAQSMKEHVDTGADLTKELLSEIKDKETPCFIAQQFLQQEVHKLF